MRRLAALLAVLTAPAVEPAPAHAQPAGENPAEVRVPVHSFRFDLYDGRIYVPMRVNGLGPYLFVLDTGAQTTHFTVELVHAAGLPVTGSIGISGIGTGRVEGLRVGAASLDLEGLAFPVRSGIAAAADALFGPIYLASGRRFDGIIGYDLFARYVTEIDYAAGEIRLYDPDAFHPPEGAQAVPIRIVERKPYAEAAITFPAGDTVAARLHLDTGFGGGFSFNGRFVKDHKMVERAGRTLPSLSRGVGGAAGARLARLGSVRIGTLLVDRPLASLSLVQGAGVRADSAGRIGGGVLRRYVVTLDYGRGIGWFVPGATAGLGFEADMSGMSLVADHGVSDAVRVERLIPEGPAAAAGIETGDHIVGVEGIPVAELTLEQVRAYFREDGQTRTLIVRRGLVDQAIVITLRRLL